MGYLLALGSAVFLGFYDVGKKASLKNNSVFPVLFLCSLSATLFLLPSFFDPYVLSIDLWTHFFLLGKAMLVTSSWVLTFHAIAHLPLSIAAPIRACAPLFTIFLAVSFMGERPSGFQWLGIGTLFFSYFLFSIAERKLAGCFWKNKWILVMFAGTFLGALSGLYDKLLIQNLKLSPVVVQIWFCIYLTFLQGILLLFFSKFSGKQKQVFRFRWTIPFVGILLVIADRLYFMALDTPETLISTVSVIRRSNVIVSFIGGIFLWKEKLTSVKLIAFIGICTGLAIMGLG